MDMTAHMGWNLGSASGDVRPRREDILERFVAERPALHSFMRLLLPAQQVDDAVQDVFVIVADRWHTYDPGQPLGPWLRGIARNVARRVRESAGQVTMAPEALVDAFDRAFSDAESADERDHIAEALPLLQHCLDGLSASARELLHQRYALGRDLAGIARSLGRTSGAVQVALSRLRSVLMDCISRQSQASRRT